MTTRAIPPTSELFPATDFVARHPSILTLNRVKWAARNRAINGASSAFYDTRGGELLVHEPEFLRWFLRLDGRSKPRASARRRQR
jgi:hypothetical protein